MVDWKYYEKRRKVNFESFLKLRNIESYEQFCDELNRMGIIPITKEEYLSKLPKPEKEKSDIKPPPTKPPPKPKRKYTKRKKK